MLNPRLPILIRESSGVQPRLFARYGTSSYQAPLVRVSSAVPAKCRPRNSWTRDSLEAVPLGVASVQASRDEQLQCLRPWHCRGLRSGGALGPSLALCIEKESPHQRWAEAELCKHLCLISPLQCRVRWTWTCVMSRYSVSGWNLLLSCCIVTGWSLFGFIRKHGMKRECLCPGLPYLQIMAWSRACH